MSNKRTLPVLSSKHSGTTPRPGSCYWLVEVSKQRAFRHPCAEEQRALTHLFHLGKGFPALHAGLAQHTEADPIKAALLEIAYPTYEFVRHCRKWLDRYFGSSADNLHCRHIAGSLVLSTHKRSSLPQVLYTEGPSRKRVRKVRAAYASLFAWR